MMGDLALCTVFRMGTFWLLVRPNVMWEVVLLYVAYDNKDPGFRPLYAAANQRNAYGLLSRDRLCEWTGTKGWIICTEPSRYRNGQLN